MANTVPIKKMQAADPGIGIEMDLNNVTDLLKGCLNLQLEMIVSHPDGQHHSTLTIGGPMIDSSIVVVLPFGSLDYKVGKVLEVSLNISVHNERNQITALEPTGVPPTLTCEAGHFMVSILGYP